MPLSLMGVEPKHERRLRVTFNQPLAVGSFVASKYTITNDGTATSPTVSSAIVVASDSSTVELALSNELVRGVIYTLTVTGAVAQDASTFTGSNPFQYGTKVVKNTLEPALRNRERIILQVDLVWNGIDYQEAPNGDLARVEGRENVTKNLWRSVETAGLPWDPGWGVNAREWVDSPSPAGSTLRGAMARQVGRDPRVKTVTSTVTQSGNATYISIVPVLISGLTLEPVSTKVDNGTT